MILVDVYIPSLDETYNFRVDEMATVTNVVQEISEMMCKKFKTQLNYPANNFYLCSDEMATVLEEHTTLAENGIHNGSRLFIV